MECADLRELYASEVDAGNPHANGNGNGSSEEGWYGADSDFVTGAQAKACHPPVKERGVRSIRPGAL